MVVVLSNKKQQKQQVQVESSPQKPIPIYLNLIKDAEVQVYPEYLSLFGKKVKRMFDEKNKQRAEDSKKGIIHIGNITGCARQAMLTEQNLDDIEMTIWDYADFMDGLGSEEMIVRVLNHGKEVNGEFQKDIVFDNFVGHPDYIDEIEGKPVIFELKNSKKIKPFILSEDTMKNYIRQILLYMILDDIAEGIILVRYARPDFPEYITKDQDRFDMFNFIGDGESLYKLKFHKETGQFPFFAVKLDLPLDSPNRDIIKKGLKEITAPLYQSGDPKKLPILPDRDNNWKCQKYCKVKDLCYQTPDEQDDAVKRFVLLNHHLDSIVNKKISRFRKRQPVDIQN
jgi:hypothetical protein